uniref:guanine nucleotide exchange factor DBS isoform X2 n=1 Tax=Myxine glutinosa TaxID=7769 RepID=UPI00358DFDE0
MLGSQPGRGSHKICLQPSYGETAKIKTLFSPSLLHSSFLPPLEQTPTLPSIPLLPPEELLQPGLRPLLAFQIRTLLARRVAYLSGGKSRSGSLIITFPYTTEASTESSEDFHTVLTYLSSIPSLAKAEWGFTLLIDSRGGRWGDVRTVLSRLSTCCAADVRGVLLLPPATFSLRPLATLACRLLGAERNMRAPLVMLGSLSDLSEHVDIAQLTPELGGSLSYSHERWLNERTEVEAFAVTVKGTAQLLAAFGADLAETGTPANVLGAEGLLETHAEKRNRLKEEMSEAVGRGHMLLASITQEHGTEDESGDAADNVSTVERLLVQLHEAEAAFDEFWEHHEMKLEQNLRLCHFQQDYREVISSLNSLEERLASMPEHGESLPHAERTLRELLALQEKSQDWLDHATALGLRGDHLVSEPHYAADWLEAACAEVCSQASGLSVALQTRQASLISALELEQRLDKAMAWCERGVYLLASQPVEKCQSSEGAQAALDELHTFMDSWPEQGAGTNEPLLAACQVVPSYDLAVRVAHAEQKVQEVRDMFERREQGLRKLAVKHPRPVQTVAPRPESPRSNLVEDAHDERAKECDAERKTNENLPKMELLPEDGLCGGGKMDTSGDGQDSIIKRRRHIMKELTETERVYVEELNSIIEGYVKAFENPSLAQLIPVDLQEKKDQLFGNLPEIYSFHSRVFLKELEAYVDDPELLGRCFLQRKEDFQMYEKYCQNKLCSEAVWRRFGDNQFFQECQRRIDHKLALDSYLLKPVQRITKYQLLLKEMLKCSKNSPGTAALEEALNGMLAILKAVNDSMHQLSITGFDGDLAKLGHVLMQGPFAVWTEARKGHNMVKELTRFKPMQRHLFLFPSVLLFCKRREEAGESARPGDAPYSFKHLLKMNLVGITETVKGDAKKFEINYNGREEAYTIQAPSMEVKTIWLSEIRKVLTSQLEACKEASQLQLRISDQAYHVPMSLDMRNAPLRPGRKTSWNQVRSRSENMSPKMPPRRASFSKNTRSNSDSPSPSIDNSKKRFTFPNMNNAKDLPAVQSGSSRRFSATPALGGSSKHQNKDAVTMNNRQKASSIRTKIDTKSPSKLKRHEIKSDPNPLGNDVSEQLISSLEQLATRCSSTSSLGTPCNTIINTDWVPKAAPTVDNNEDYGEWSSAEDGMNSSDVEDDLSTQPSIGGSDADNLQQKMMSPRHVTITEKLSSDSHWLLSMNESQVESKPFPSLSSSESASST